MGNYGKWRMPNNVFAKLSALIAISLILNTPRKMTEVCPSALALLSMKGTGRDPDGTLGSWLCSEQTIAICGWFFLSFFPSFCL